MGANRRIVVTFASLAVAGCATAPPGVGDSTPASPSGTTCLHYNADAENAAGYCHAVRVGQTLYLSGTSGVAPMGGAVNMVYAKLQSALRAQGLDFRNVVKETVFTTDIDAFVAENETRKRFYAGAQPAATWVQVDRLGQPDRVLTVELVATFPK